MRKILTNQNYIKTATASVPLFYSRSKLKSGEKIKGFKINACLVEGLKTCNTVVFSMYWKPIGDSLLFLSIVQACCEYLQLIRPFSMPKFVLDSKFSSLIKHIPIFEESEVVDGALLWFKEGIQKGEKMVLITDDDPFAMKENPPIFNSEEYIYPKFYEVISEGQIKEYPSRPARYFLTFEREVGKRLISDPNESLPDFILEKDKKLRQKCLEKFFFDPDEGKREKIGIVSQAGLAEKKFGCLRYLKLLSFLIPLFKFPLALFLTNSKEESPLEWRNFNKKRQDFGEKLKLIDAEDLELLAYIFARCKLVVGNDTGFSHLAAMSRQSVNGPIVPVFIIYSRHDFRKWSTGKNNVFPITTKLSEYLAENNMSVRRDKIDLSRWGEAEWACSVKVKDVLKKIHLVCKI